jgi:hypothetical protein
MVNALPSLSSGIVPSTTKEVALMESNDEFESLRSQFAISKGRGGRRYLSYAFTEHGAIMATAVQAPHRVQQRGKVMLIGFARV